MPSSLPLSSERDKLSRDSGALVSQFKIARRSAETIFSVRTISINYKE